MPGKPARAFTIDDLWRIERLGAISLSPDGAQAVCTLSSPSMDDNTAHSALCLLSTLGGAPRRLTSCGEKDGQAAWSPTGDAIAFVARREQQGRKDDAPQLYTIAPDGGEARRASDFAPGVEAFKWFPDGRRIAFIAWVWPDVQGTQAQAKRHKAFKERKESGYATSEAQYRFWDHNLPMGRVAHLHVLDTRTGRVRDLFEGSRYELSRASPDAHAFDIAPDGRTICFAFDPQLRKQIDHCLALAEIDVKSGSVHEVAVDAAWDFGAPCYSPDGRYIAFTASHQGKRHTMPAHLALLRRASKRQTPTWQLLSAQWDRSVNAPLRWGEDGDAIFFGAEDHGRCHLWRLGIASPEPAVVVRGGWLQAFDVGCASGVIVSVADASHHPARAHALRADAAGPLRMETFNDALLAPWRLRPAEEVVFAGANGDAVQMWLTYPPGFEGSKGGAKKRKTWPILHSIHGGPHAAAGDT
ncbi:MAG: PD40 domain-containing protein, partial [Piscinibacter sp.]|nr:PD40 domain-containing protein [Piscinibacter sp.]